MIRDGRAVLVMGRREALNQAHTLQKLTRIPWPRCDSHMEQASMWQSAVIEDIENESTV